VPLQGQVLVHRTDQNQINYYWYFGADSGVFAVVVAQAVVPLEYQSQKDRHSVIRKKKYLADRASLSGGMLAMQGLLCRGYHYWSSCRCRCRRVKIKQIYNFG
jgi:hypothetical protein